MEYSVLPALVCLSFGCSEASPPGASNAEGKPANEAELDAQTKDAPSAGGPIGLETQPGDSPVPDVEPDADGYTDAEKRELGDYSTYSTTGQYLETYPDQTAKPPANYPALSWKKIPRWSAFRSVTRMSDEDIALIAENVQLAMLEKANDQGTGTVEDGTLDIAARLKAENPESTTLFYWTTNINYLGYFANGEHNANA